MTAIVINGEEYDLDEGLAGAELNHLLFLKQKAGLGLKTIVGKLQGFGKYAEDDDASEEDKTMSVLAALDDVDTLNAFRAIVWLLRTKHGDRDMNGQYLSIDAANEGVSLTDFGGPGTSADEPAADTAQEEQPAGDPTSLADGQEPAPAS